MSLAPGTRLGPYQIESAVGAGGMGEVYKARDTRLDRPVAIKVLSPDVGSDPDRRSRFEREARAVAALNHPHICALYDVGREGGTDFLVMELVAGETLEHRLHGEDGRSAPRPLKPEDVQTYAIEIAEALAAAHETGIVHRDLKPDNIMLTGSGVKLLDFGLAKWSDRVVAAGMSETTFAAPVTSAGMVVGTLGYLSPEQARGEVVDARSDLFAFGCVLYEMLSAVRPFTGATATDVVAAVLRDDPPPLDVTKRSIPPALDLVVRQCLQKDRAARFQSARDIVFVLRSFPDPVAPAAAARHDGWRWRAATFVSATAALIAVLALLLGGGPWAPRGSPESSHLSLSVANGLTVMDTLTVSPDGRTVIFSAAAGGGKPRLYARQLDDLKPRPIPGTEGANKPFFSLDGKFLAYWVPGQGLYRIDVSWAHAPERLTPGVEMGGGAYTPDGKEIVFSTLYAPPRLWKVSSEGGEALPLGAEGSKGAMYLWPEVLPDGRVVLFTILEKGEERLATLTLADGRVRTLRTRASRPRYLAPLHLLVYQSQGKLHASPFDPEALVLSAGGRDVVDPIDISNLSGAFPESFDVSRAGTLVYRAPTLAGLVWKDRNGRTEKLPIEAGRYWVPSLSPDGSRLAVTLQTSGARTNIWYAGVGGQPPLTELTVGYHEMYPLITRDGSLFYTSERAGRYCIFRAPFDGSGNARQFTDRAPAKATSVSPDSRTVLINALGEANSFDVLRCRIDGSDVQPVLNSRFNEIEATFSPDGQWIAYQSDETGHHEIYVRAWPGLEGKVQVSRGGGLGAVWNPRGGELFFQGSEAFMTAKVVNGRAGAPVALFRRWDDGNWNRRWDVTPDGQRFLMVDSAPREIIVVQNWFDELKKKLR